MSASDSEEESTSTSTSSEQNELLYGPMESAVVAAAWRDIKARLAKHKQVLSNLDGKRKEGMQSLVDAEEWELETFKEDYADQLVDEKLDEDDDESDNDMEEMNSESSDEESAPMPMSKSAVKYGRRRY